MIVPLKSVNSQFKSRFVSFFELPENLKSSNKLFSRWDSPKSSSKNQVQNKFELKL